MESATNSECVGCIICSSRLKNVDPFCTVIPALLLLLVGILVIVFGDKIYGWMILTPCFFIIPAIAVAIYHKTKKASPHPLRDALRRRRGQRIMAALRAERAVLQLSTSDGVQSVRVTTVEGIPIRHLGQVRSLQTTTTGNSSTRQPGRMTNPHTTSPARQVSGVRNSRVIVGSSPVRQFGATRNPQIIIEGSPTRQISVVRSPRTITRISPPLRQSQILGDVGISIPPFREPQPPLDLPPSYEEATRSDCYYPPPAYED